MRHFTNVSCAVWAAGVVLGGRCWTVGCLLACFTTVSFHAAEVLVPGTFVRMRHANGWPPWYFHGGNLLLHWVPTAKALASPPSACGSSLVVACWVFWSWGLWASKGRMVFDDHYVPLPPHAWHLSHMCGLTAMMAYHACLAA